MRGTKGLAILFSVCLILGVGQLLATNATTIEVPAMAFVVNDVAPDPLPAKVPAPLPDSPATPTPADDSTPVLATVDFTGCTSSGCTNCHNAANYQPTKKVRPATDDTTSPTTSEDEDGRGRPGLRAVAGAGKVVGRLIGCHRRAERRSSR